MALLREHGSSLQKCFITAALCSTAPLMAKAGIFCNFHYSGTPKEENKAVKVSNQTVMTPQAIDGTGVVIGPGTGLVGVEVLAGWGSTKNSPTCVTPGPSCEQIVF